MSKYADFDAQLLDMIEYGSGKWRVIDAQDGADHE